MINNKQPIYNQTSGYSIWVVLLKITLNSPLVTLATIYLLLPYYSCLLCQYVSVPAFWGLLTLATINSQDSCFSRRLKCVTSYVFINLFCDLFLVNVCFSTCVGRERLESLELVCSNCPSKHIFSHGSSHSGLCSHIGYVSHLKVRSNTEHLCVFLYSQHSQLIQWMSISQ